MINPTLAQAHLNKGEPGMVEPTPLVSNSLDAGAASKIALNPQQEIGSQQMMSKVGQDADAAVIGKIADENAAARTAQLADSQAQEDAARAISTMIYAKLGSDSATASFSEPGMAERVGKSVFQQAGIRNSMA
mgnify:CR=1 FL=1